MNPVLNRRMGGRQGVALILVIGMLALMMVMGVTFSIFMRTERLAAGHFRADVQARELLQVALARALDAIDASVGGTAYPTWDILQSSYTADTNTTALVGSVSNWIPWAVLAATNAAPRWSDDKLLPSGGRFSYLVLNCSGLLDANYAGGGTRLGGTNATEIQTSLLPGGEVPDPVSLANGRPYVNIQDFVAQGKLNGQSSNFVAFSAALTNGLVDISGDADALFNRRDSIVSGLMSAIPGLSAAEAGTFFTNLVDYVDTDCIPGNLGGHAPAQPEGPYVEPVWMYNEVYANSSMTLAPAGADIMISGASVKIRNECFFPFLGADKSGYKLELSLMFTNCSAPSLMPRNGNPVKLGPTAIGAVASAYVEPNMGFPIPLMGGTHPSNLTMHIEIAVSAIIRDAGGNAVDAVTNQPVMLAWDCVPNAGGTAASGVADKECVDPRLNHLATSWKNTTAAAGNTIGFPNAAATDPKWRQQWSDQGLDMYVANRPLASVGELGYLFSGNNWQTLRLFRHTVQPFERKTYLIWDHFTVHTNQVLKGLVNVNTRDRDVLMSVFENLPIDYPHGNATTRLQNPQLGAVVDAIMAKTAAGGITNLSDLGTIGWTNVWTSGTEMDCESILRNSCDLLTTRPQYFLILVYAQMNKPAVNSTNVISGIRGIAEVWRDSNSPNLKFIRTLQVIPN